MIKQYALVENGIVINTIVADANFISQQSGQWIEYTELRPAYVGGQFIDGVLIAPKPFPSWNLDSNYNWQAPVAKPEGNFVWNEETQSWVVPAAG